MRPSADRSVIERGADLAMSAPLPATFYDRPTLRVARALLGKILVHRSRDGITAGRIVEVEAYRGPADRAAHTAGGRRTPRNEAMWGPGGRLYVYFTYGMHHCCNVVTRRAEVPEAVLLRALAPVAGVELMRRRRGRGGRIAEEHLARGPGNLCRAMGIDTRLNDADLTAAPVWITDAARVPNREVGVSARIGVAYAGSDALLPWRFFVRDCPAVSGHGLRPGPGTRVTRVHAPRRDPDRLLSSATGATTGPKRDRAAPR